MSNAEDWATGHRTKGGMQAAASVLGVRWCGPGESRTVSRERFLQVDSASFSVQLDYIIR